MVNSTKARFGKLPCSPQLVSVCAEQGWNIYELATSGGEDFELLFTGPAGLEACVDFAVYPIGKIVEGDSLTWTIDGRPVDVDFIGYKHF